MAGVLLRCTTRAASKSKYHIRFVIKHQVSCVIVLFKNILTFKLHFRNEFSHLILCTFFFGVKFVKVMGVLKSGSLGNLNVCHLSRLNAYSFCQNAQTYNSESLILIINVLDYRMPRRAGLSVKVS